MSLSSADWGDASRMGTRMSQLQNMRSIGETRAKSQMTPPNQRKLGVVRFTERRVDVHKNNGSKRFGPCKYPHVKISSKFEVLGPRNGRVAGPRQNPSKLRLYSRVVQCEIRKFEVYDIDVSRPSPESKSGRGIH